MADAMLRRRVQAGAVIALVVEVGAAADDGHAQLGSSVSIRRYSSLLQ